MKSKKLTKQQIDSVQPSAKDVYLWDTSPPGFGVRIRSSGAKTFIFSYRPGGGRSASKKRHTIGRYGKITLEQARTLAQQLAGHVAAGGTHLRELKLEAEMSKLRGRLPSVGLHEVCAS
ncbi:Arm DNA-binding domain-containing protein [uncultured Reyranella sp.]|uniref:Arm DNA-binding domain-containing protein n=1 Tax=uncultured Reyranella sp. TaxID=735512 RepID=UPI0025FDE82E|nr:Arm DNA-binding domain-containing protein [uncultured Reyranella sp.]